MSTQDWQGRQRLSQALRYGAQAGMGPHNAGQHLGLGRHVALPHSQQALQGLHLHPQPVNRRYLSQCHNGIDRTRT